MLEKSIDGTEVSSWYAEGLRGRRQHYGVAYRVVYERTGSVERPVISIGTNGAGLFLDEETGKLVAVDENGDTSTLTG